MCRFMIYDTYSSTHRYTIIIHSKEILKTREPHTLILGTGDQRQREVESLANIMGLVGDS